MLFSILHRLFTAGRPGRPGTEPALAPEGAAEAFENRPGSLFVPIAPTQLLSASDDILRRIRLCYGREPQQFEQDVMVIVTRYADFVNALPATASNYFSAPGGLFRLGLDTAFFSLQATDAQIFEGRATITQRRHLEPRWRQATFIAGLCAALQPTLNTVSVVAPDDSSWPSYLLPLSNWLARYPHARVRLVWRTAATVDGVQNLYALPHIVPPGVMEYLAERNDVVVPTMLATLSRLPLANPPSTMAALVRRAAALSIARELRRMAAAQGTPPQGDHVGRLLVDIMHDLVHGAASWIPNSSKARLWHAQDGTFVVWPGAFQDVCIYADRERLHGLPPDADDAIVALERAGMIVRAQEGPLWSLRPPGTNGDLTGLKLAFPELVLGAQLATCPPLPPLCPQPERSRTTQPETGHTAPTPKSEEAPHKPLADAPPEQLQLPLAQRPPASVPADPASPNDPDAPPPAAPALVNSMRLPAVVADVLRRALAGLAEDGNAGTTHVIREGVLIPMQVFRSANLDGKMVTRCLRDAGMLVVGESGNPTYTVKSEGTEVRGLVIKRQCVTGLIPTDRCR